jgi:hypothetical protein
MVFRLITITVILFLACRPSLLDERKDIEYAGFQPFPLNRGYEPGTLLKINNDQISAPIFERDELVRSIFSTQIFSLNKPKEISQFEMDITREFKSNSNAFFSPSSASASATIGKIQNVSYKIESGQTYSLDGGTKIFRNLIDELNKRELEILLEEIKTNENVFLVSEVLEYDKAQIVFRWNDGVNLDAKIEKQLVESISINSTNQRVEKGTLTINIDTPQIVGFNKISINDSHINLIERRLKNESGKPPLEKCFSYNLESCSYIKNQIREKCSILHSQVSTEIKSCDSLEPIQIDLCRRTKSSYSDKCTQEQGIVNAIVDKVYRVEQTCTTFGHESDRCSVEKNRLEKDIIDFKNNYPSIKVVDGFDFQNIYRGN